MVKFTSLTFLLLWGLCFSLAGKAQTRSGSISRGSVYVVRKSGVLLDFGIHYGQAEATGNPSAQNFKNNTSVYDIKLGYVSEGNWYIGGLYSVKNYSTISGSSNGKTGGLGFGYLFRNNFNIRAFYRHNDVFGEYREGSGFQADLEYKVSFASNFYIGALISHRQVTFKANDTISNFQDYTLKETYPAISLGFLIN